jgi:prepilin-type processing-associated H-X9-DG protein
MYADDSNDRILYASDDGTGSANPLNQYAWTSSHMDFSPYNRANWDTNVDITVRPLWPYTSRKAAIYKCPSDPSYVVVYGVVRPRVRSMSMNLYLGGLVGTDWSWVSVPYRIYTRTSQFSGYSGLPAKIFVFLDQRFDSINWGSFMMNMSGYDPVQPAAWQFDQDVPGMYHDQACGFSFVDGHCEMKRWLDPRTTLPYGNIPVPLPSPSNPDVYWLQDHSTRWK